MSWNNITPAWMLTNKGNTMNDVNVNQEDQGMVSTPSFKLPTWKQEETPVFTQSKEQVGDEAEVAA
jgi:hypothetical protein